MSRLYERYSSTDIITTTFCKFDVDKGQKITYLIGLFFSIQVYLDFILFRKLFMRLKRVAPSRKFIN